MLKKIIFFTLWVLLMVSCSYEENNKAAIDWISSSQKPITAVHSGYGFMGGNKYTLLSADGKVFYTGVIDMDFPPNINIIEVIEKQKQ